MACDLSILGINMRSFHHSCQVTADQYWLLSGEVCWLWINLGNFHQSKLSILMTCVHWLFILGGEVCQLGGRWVVNPSGGLESKGTTEATLCTTCFLKCCGWWYNQGNEAICIINKLSTNVNMWIGGACVESEEYILIAACDSRHSYFQYG